MKRGLIRIFTLLAAFLALIAVHPVVIGAQENPIVRPSDRSGDMEFSIPIIYTDSTTINGSGGSYADLNSDWSSGFGIGYNINERFLINGLFAWSSRGYDAEAVLENGSTRKYNGTMESTTLSLNGTYFFLDKNITPFVTGGIGWTYIDTNIPSGTADGYCYWDPWWGYMCTSYVPTKSENEVSYTAGLGLRWDITRNFTLQAGYTKMWVDIREAKGGMPDFDVFKMDIIFRSRG